MIDLLRGLKLEDARSFVWGLVQGALFWKYVACSSLS